MRDGEPIAPGQARSALTTVIRRMIEALTFDANDWLQIGLSGDQALIDDDYFSTGSRYIWTNGLVALGLAPGDESWTGEFMGWTSRKAWTRQNVEPDHALET